LHGVPSALGRPQRLPSPLSVVMGDEEIDEGSVAGLWPVVAWSSEGFA